MSLQPTVAARFEPVVRLLVGYNKNNYATMFHVSCVLWRMHLTHSSLPGKKFSPDDVPGSLFQLERSLILDCHDYDPVAISPILFSVVYFNN